ncbi:MAG: hypothetical protein M3Y87_26075 [Myxococcota bacterium]|nr:hypothetical protein [Myxococcota bacterium]
MLTFRRRHDLALRVAALLFFGLALAGCGPGSAWAMALAAMLSLGSLALSGCSTSHTPRPDGEVARTDAGPGSWDTCCNEGRLDTCFCPAMTACNYGMGLVICDDGTCGYGFGGGEGFSCEADADAGPVADAGGDWEPCCDDGTITTCFCPGGAECNYGWFTTCPDGSCTVGDSCDAPPPIDAGVERDAGEPGSWDPCCVDGMITTCFCPAGAICNYGLYEDCGGGYCTSPGDSCFDPEA